jgi:hypothetical protein
VADIERHYREQLHAYGWVLEDHGDTSHWAWSAWQFTDSRGDPWTGLLIVMQPRDQTEMRQLFLQAVAASSGPRQTDSGSWTRFGSQRP